MKALLNWRPSWLEPTSTGAPTVSVPIPGATAASPGWTGTSASIPFLLNDADDRVGSLIARCSLDGAPATVCSAPLKLQHLAAGQHTLQVRATDPAGNAGSAGTSWRVEATAPTVSLKALPSVNLSTSVTVGWAALDSGGSGLWSSDARYREWSAEGPYSGAVYTRPAAGRACAPRRWSCTRMREPRAACRPERATGPATSVPGAPSGVS